MGRKRLNSRRKKTAVLRRRGQKAHNLQKELGKRIVSLIQTRKHPLDFAEILAELHLPRSARARVKKTLNKLTDIGKVRRKGKIYLAVGDHGRQLRAVLDTSSLGDGFATVDNQRPEEKDIFIAARHLGSAVRGDTVMVEVIGNRRGRREGRVVRIVQRAFTRICGIFTDAGRDGLVLPDHDQLPQPVRIRQKYSKGAVDGHAVLVEITDYGTPERGPEGKVVELLGPPENAGTQIRMAMLRFALPTGFPQAVQRETDQLCPVTQPDAHRLDLRHLPHVTIDGATARDFDDAICVESTTSGFRLHVSIADVSTYVQPDTAIDREAFHRGTSIYLPDRVIPMLPERLSNDLCSLVPLEDRPAFTVILDFDQQGRRQSSRYVKSLIRSRCRFTYEEVNRILFLHCPKTASTHQDLLPMLKDTGALVELLNQQRRKRGSLGFNLPEARITLDGDHVSEITVAERSRAHQLVEECMLAANEAVAETLYNAGIPALFRIHEQPDPAKVEQFTDAARAMGLELPRTEMSPAWFAGILARAQGTDAEYVINNLLLRTMQQARYTPENHGHFGLAAPYYLHFTSPIRRYPDLVAHRALQCLLLQGEQAEKTEGQGNSLASSGVYLSERERHAVNVERDIRARLSTVYMLSRLGEQFTAIVSGVNSFGVFIELTDHFISGAIPLTTMTDDDYLVDKRGHRLIGERTHRVVQLGQTLDVVLEHVDLANRRLTFSCADHEAVT
ncbi:MAG: ribonuclease R [Desulfobulbus propionicus]|nr:MAG: ribonuclease R [Desulfobulbus propionicus]